MSRKADTYRGARRNRILRSQSKSDTLALMRAEAPGVPRQQLRALLWSAPARNRGVRKSPRNLRRLAARTKGQFERHIIRVVTTWREFKLHATKGWRSYRLTDGAAQLRRMAA